LAVVWIKFHNLVVDEFSKLYPNLSADAKFYEARKFVIGIYQHIFYSEVLPLLVSAKAIARYRLASKKPCYDHNIDPSVTAEFTASTARYFHTFIQNSYVINFKNGTKADILLRNFNDELLGYRELAGVLTGLLERPWNTLDIANEVKNYSSFILNLNFGFKQPSNYLFTANGGPGLDLRAIDLQTERDFGIGTYCDALYFFNLTKGECIKKFSDFEPFITDSVLHNIL
jgi:peroxidase